MQKTWCDMKTEGVMRAPMHLVPHWMARIQEDCVEEVENDAIWPMKLLENEARRTIWGICKVLNVDQHGVPAQACRLMERYLAVQIRIYIDTPMGSAEWADVKRSLLAKLPLLMISCIQLASKMNTAYIDVSATAIRAKMACYGYIYSTNDISKTEFQVFSMLGFRIPLWSSEQVGEALAVYVGLPEAVLEAIRLVVNLAEYQRDWLDRRVRWAANVNPVKYNRVTIRTLHLAAGSVMASIRYLKFNWLDPAPRLAKITNAPVCYLRCISNIIVGEMLVDASECGPSQKIKNDLFSRTLFSNNPLKRKNN